MNRRQFIGTAVAVPIVAVAGCVGDDAGDAIDKFTEYLEAVVEGDQETADELVHREGARSPSDDIEELEGGTIEEIDEEPDLETVLYDRLDLEEIDAGEQELLIETLLADIEDFVDIEEEAYMYYRVDVDGEDVEWYGALILAEDLWWVI